MSIANAMKILLLGPVLIAGCGGTQYTVSGHTLQVNEVSFGSADYYCSNLANGELEVVMSDVAMCDRVRNATGDKNISAFHGVDETNLRLIFPSQFKVPPFVNQWTVGTSNCVDQVSEGTQAVAYFSHSAAGAMGYDVNVQANSGKIVVSSYKSQNDLQGTFDLTFGSDHISGSFDASYCSALQPTLGAQ